MKYMLSTSDNAHHSAFQANCIQPHVIVRLQEDDYAAFIVCPSRQLAWLHSGAVDLNRQIDIVQKIDNDPDSIVACYADSESLPLRHIRCPSNGVQHEHVCIETRNSPLQQSNSVVSVYVCRESLWTWTEPGHIFDYEVYRSGTDFRVVWNNQQTDGVSVRDVGASRTHHIQRVTVSMFVTCECAFVCTGSTRDAALAKWAVHHAEHRGIAL